MVAGIEARSRGAPRNGALRALDREKAAAAVLALETPLPELLRADGTLPRISGIGPGSTRVIREVVETGSSPTVEAAINQSERRDDIERRQALRSHFLSRAEVLRILRDPAFGGPDREAYRGDLQMHVVASGFSRTSA